MLVDFGEHNVKRSTVGFEQQAPRLTIAQSSTGEAALDSTGKVINRKETVEVRGYPEICIG